MVQGPTRMDPPRMLDPILTTLGCYYQSPVILPPLDCDPDKEGRPSDHWIPVMRPINQIDNRCSRTYKEIIVRPIHQSGMALLTDWFEGQDWFTNIQCDSVDMKADRLMSQILGAVNKYLPTKTIRVASDDEPWYNQALKKLDRRRRREYNKNRRSQKYQKLNHSYLQKVAKAKKSYKRNMIDDIKNAKPGEWYSKLKRISRYDQGNSEYLQVEEINHLSDLEQAERIASKQAEISNSYRGVQLEDIPIPPFSAADIPQFSPAEVKEYIMKLKSKKSTAPGDIPVKIIKEFAQQISIPLCDIINSSLLKGEWAGCFKKEIITPIPKQYPVTHMVMLRPISCLLSFNKVQEMIIVEMIVQDMAGKLDPL